MKTILILILKFLIMSGLIIGIMKIDITNSIKYVRIQAAHFRITYLEILLALQTTLIKNTILNIKQLLIKLLGINVMTELSAT